MSSVAQLATAQRTEQAALASLLADPLERAWETLDASDPSSFDNFLAAVSAIVRHFGTISASHAAKFYTAVRQASDVSGSYVASQSPLPNLDQIEAGLRWATKGIWTPKPDLASAKVLVTGVVEKDSLDMGRQTVLRNVRRDRKSKGWARETEAGCCSFCAMLATRGAVYRSESTADFQSHDHCHCIAVPEFNKYEPSAQVREWQQLYKESTKGAHGSKNAQRAFRKAYETKYPSAT